MDGESLLTVGGSASPPPYLPTSLPPRLPASPPPRLPASLPPLDALPWGWGADQPPCCGQRSTGRGAEASCLQHSHELGNSCCSRSGLRGCGPKSSFTSDPGPEPSGSFRSFCLQIATESSAVRAGAGRNAAECPLACGVESIPF